MLPRGGSESYNLDIGSREYDFAPMLVIVGGDKGRRIEVVRRGGAGGEVKRAEGGGWEVRVLKARDGWDERSGCMRSPSLFWHSSSFSVEGASET